MGPAGRARSTPSTTFSQAGYVPAPAGPAGDRCGDIGDTGDTGEIGDNDRRADADDAGVTTLPAPPAGRPVA